MKRNTIKLLKEDKSIRETQAKEASHRVHQRNTNREENAWCKCTLTSSRRYPRVKLTLLKLINDKWKLNDRKYGQVS